MNSKIDVTVYYDLEGFIHKKSTNFFIGFQNKFWKILDQGTKIAYRNLHDSHFSPSKTFHISDVKTEELEAAEEFQLHTPERVYQLRAKTEEQCKIWMRAITMLKKDLRKKSLKNAHRKNKTTKQRNCHDSEQFQDDVESPKFSQLQIKPPIRQKSQSLSSPTFNHQICIQQPSHYPQKGRSVSIFRKETIDETIPSSNQIFSFEKKTAKFRSSVLSMMDSDASSLVMTILERDQVQMSLNTMEPQLRDKFSEFLAKLAPDYVNFHVYIGNLKTKSKELLSTNTSSNYYIFFSSKSLYPQQHISQQNLTNALLPYWADTNTLYRLSNENTAHKVFQLGRVERVQISQEDYSVKVISGHQSFQLFVDSREQQYNLKEIIQIGKVNALQTGRHQLCLKKNYDPLVLLHATNIEEFNQNIRQMVKRHQPSGQNKQLSMFGNFMIALNANLYQIGTILEHKVAKQAVKHTLVDMVKVINQEVKTFLKLTWDSSYEQTKGIDVSSTLKSLSTYQTLASNYSPKDNQLFQAQKQLSKIYMRFCYQHFEKMIVNLVQKQANAKPFTACNEGEQPYSQTHVVSHLFQLMYDLLALAGSCWNHRVHLNNIHKMVHRAITVFMKELKVMVDEEELQIPLLIAISNNYVSFAEEIEVLYQGRFAELGQSIKYQSEGLKAQFREISMVVIDKLVWPVKMHLKSFFQLQTFHTVPTQQAYRLIIQSPLYQHMPNVHFIQKKRYYERIFTTIREQIYKLLQREVQSPKKKSRELKKVIERINIYKMDCVQMAQLLCKSRLKMQKQFGELVLLLTTSKKEEVAFILAEATDLYKRVYRKVLSLREDYASVLQHYLRALEMQSPRNSPQESSKDLEPRKTFSKDSMMDEVRTQINSDQKSIEPTSDEKVRMISEGYVLRHKAKGGSFEKIYLKLKKSVLYVYQNQKIERCRNSIQIAEIFQVKVANGQKPHFTIHYLSLHRNKQLKAICESAQESRRWMFTIQLELKRLQNDKKMKVAKNLGVESNIIIDYEELNNGKDHFSYEGQSSNN